MKKALATVDGISDVDCNVGDNSCTFSAPAKLDVEATLDKLVEGGSEHIKDWSKAE